MGGRTIVAGIAGLSLLLAGCSDSDPGMEAAEEGTAPVAEDGEVAADSVEQSGDVARTTTEGAATTSVPEEENLWDNDPAEEAWSLDLRPLSRAMVVDDIAVLYTDDLDDSLSVAAVDVATGELLWQSPTSPGRTGGPLAAPPVIETDDGPVIVVRERSPRESADNWWSALIALDLRTGEQMAQSTSVVADGAIYACESEDSASGDTRHGAVCFDGYVGSGDNDGSFTGTVAGDEVVVEKEPESSESSEASGEEDEEGWSSWSNFDFGFYTDEDDVEHYARKGEDGEMLWTTPVAEVAGDHEGLGGGGQTQHTDDAFLVTRFDLTEVDDTYAAAVEDQQVVSLDKETGEVLWQAEAVLGCFLPLTRGLGGSQERDESAESSADLAHLQDTTLVCQGTGTASVDSATGAFGGFQDLDLQLQARDPASGAVLWSHEFSGAESFLSESGSVAVPDGYLVVDVGSGAQVIDRLTGEPAAFAEGAVFLCAANQSFDYSVPALEGRERTSGYLAYACTLDGEPVDRPLSQSAVEEGGYRLPDSYLVTTAQGLAAYRH